MSPGITSSQQYVCMAMELETEYGVLRLDDCDAHLLEGRTLKVGPWGGSRQVGGSPYARVNRYFLHTLIMKPPAGLDVDHISRDTLDNRRENLRLASRSQNLANRRAWSKCGYKGVVFKPKRPGKGSARYEAWITLHGKKTHLGSAKTPEEAARLYDGAAREVWGEFAYLNFPDAE